MKVAVYAADTLSAWKQPC